MHVCVTMLHCPNGNLMTRDGYVHVHSKFNTGKRCKKSIIESQIIQTIFLTTKVFVGKFPEISIKKMKSIHSPNV